MEDNDWQIPGTILTVTEDKKEKPQSSYWTGAALSGGFWVVFCLQLLDDGASLLAYLGMLLIATVFGFTGWFGVGAAIAMVVITWAKATGAW